MKNTVLWDEVPHGETSQKTAFFVPEGGYNSGTSDSGGITDITICWVAKYSEWKQGDENKSSVWKSVLK
jgi:hypothetical protein